MRTQTIGDLALVLSEPVTKGVSRIGREELLEQILACWATPSEIEMREDTSALWFERLSVFAGDWDLAATKKVCADDASIDEVDVADLLDDLILKTANAPEARVRRRTERLA